MTARILLFPRSPDTYIHTLTEWAAQRNGRIRAVPTNGGKGPVILRLRPKKSCGTLVIHERIIK